MKLNKYTNKMLCFSLLGFGGLNLNPMEVNASEVVTSVGVNTEDVLVTQDYETSITSINTSTDLNETQLSIPCLEGLENLVINKKNNIIYMYNSPDFTSKKVATIPAYGICELADGYYDTLEDFLSNKHTDSDFIYVKSGDYFGYVHKKDIELINIEDYLNIKTSVTMLTDVEVKLTLDENSETVIVIPTNTILDVLEFSEDNQWMLVEYKNKQGYIKSSLVSAENYVDFASTYEKGTRKDVDKDIENIDELRLNIIEYALQYVGNKYVWGGTNLEKGADCSGFVQTIYKNFGYNLDRVASAQSKNGISVSENELKPGDLVFYYSDGRISHVAMYIGDGEIVHASNSRPYPSGGIKVSNYDYQTPYCFRRIITD